MPMLWNKKMSDDQVDLFYFINKGFRIGGTRRPQKEEVLEIFTALEGKGQRVPRLSDAHGMFNSGARDEVIRHNWNEWTTKVNDAYEQLIRQDADALCRDITLQGIPQRIELPNFRMRYREWHHALAAQPYQLVPLSIIATSCEDEDKKLLTPSNCYKVVKICLFGGVEGDGKLVTRCATPNVQIAKDMKAWMAKQEQHRNQFLENTQRILVIHKQELEAEGLKVHIRGVPDENPVPAVATATTAFQGLSLQATAGSTWEPDTSDPAWRQRDAELKSGGLPPQQPPRPNLDNPFGGRPSTSFPANRPTGGTQGSRAARGQDDRPRGGEGKGKRKELPQLSSETEPSKRRDTGAARPHDPVDRSSRPSGQQRDDRPEAQRRRAPSGSFEIDPEKTPPPPPIVYGRGNVSYPASRRAKPSGRERRGHERSPPPPPGSHRHSRSDRSDEDKKRREGK